MTDTEKKMKKYIRAVERRLNLPKDIKARVMADFTSSIQARREAGCTDEQIYAELGDAKKAAADLNEQMKEFAYRKSSWRWVFAAMVVYSASRLLGVLWACILSLWLLIQTYVTSDMVVGVSSVGIIGGADGPTAIFLTTPGWVNYVRVILILVVGIWGFRRFSRCKQKQ